MSGISDFNDNELWIIESTLKERYGPDAEIDIQLGDSEIRLHSSDRELTVCPVVAWMHKKCTLVIVKTGDKRYRCQYYYRVHQQYGTGIDEFDDLTECVVTLLQSQADHDRESSESS